MRGETRMSRGSVFKRGSTYTVKVDIGRDPETGKRRTHWMGGFRLKREADDYLAKFLADRLHDDGAKSRRTFEEYARTWLASRQAAPSTLAVYERCLRLHILPVVGRVKLCDTTPSHAAIVLDTMLGTRPPAWSWSWP